VADLSPASLSRDGSTIPSCPGTLPSAPVTAVRNIVKLGASMSKRFRSLRDGSCYNPRMTLMTATYELQERLKPEHFRSLGEFSNTYGLQKFRYDEKKNLLHFDYDASRLTDNVVESVLRQARIPVLRKLEPARQ
jgi:hypothetical protein